MGGGSIGSLASRRSIAFGALIAVGLVPVAPALAQTSQQIAWCSGRDNPSPEQKIAACTAVIVSGRYSGRNLALVYNNRANGHLRRNERDHALADYDEAIRLDPAYALAYNNRGNLRFLLKDYDGAIADYDQAIKLDPTPRIASDDRGRTGTNVYNNRGYAYYTKKDYARAHCRLRSGDQARAEGGADLQQSRPRLFRHQGLRARDRGFQRGDPPRADLRDRVQQSRHRLLRQARQRARHRRFQRGGAARSEIRPGVLQPRQRPCARPAATTAPSPITTPPSRSIRNMPSPTAIAPGSMRTRVTSTARSPTTTSRCGSTRPMPTTSTGAASSYSPRRTTTAPSPITTRRSSSIPPIRPP